MHKVQRLSWIAVALASTAAIIQPFAAMGPVFLGLIFTSMGLTAAGLFVAQRAQRDVDEAIMLQNRWREQRDRCKREVMNSWTDYRVEPAPRPGPEPESEPEPELEPARRGRDLIFDEEETDQ